MSRKIRIERKDVVDAKGRKRLRIDSDSLSRAGEELERLRQQRDATLAVRRVSAPCRCSKKPGSLYFIVFEETAEGGWAVVDVSTAQGTGPSTPGDKLSTVSGLDWAGYTGCLYCGDQSIVKHGAESCGQMSCQGASYKKKGKTFGRCAWCQETLEIKGTFDDVSGERSGGKGGKRG